MKIRLDELRRLIREALRSEADILSDIEAYVEDPLNKKMPKDVAMHPKMIKARMQYFKNLYDEVKSDPSLQALSFTGTGAEHNRTFGAELSGITDEKKDAAEKLQKKKKKLDVELSNAAMALQDAIKSEKSKSEIDNARKKLEDVDRQIGDIDEEIDDLLTKSVRDRFAGFRSTMDNKYAQARLSSEMFDAINKIFDQRMTASQFASKLNDEWFNLQQSSNPSWRKYDIEKKQQSIRDNLDKEDARRKKAREDRNAENKKQKEEYRKKFGLQR